MQLKSIKLTSKSRKIVDKTNRYVVKGTFAYPLVIKEGSGGFIQDVDNNWYLDFNSNVCSANIGYNHPEIVRVLKKCSSSVHKVAGQDFYTEEQMKMAEKLVKITPSSMTKVFLSNSGAEAIENAIKFAYRKKGPLPGVSCIGAFHGRTLGALTYTFSKSVQKRNYPELPHIRIKFCTSDLDPKIDEIQSVLSEKKVAFVVTEIVQGEGGYNIASKKFIKNLRNVTRKHNIPLIIDEVQSGLGRTGKWWAFEHYDIIPDIIGSAKSLQVGATITTKKYDPDEEGAVSSTWGGGDRIDLAIGLKTIEVIERERLISKVAKTGKYALSRLRELENDHPGIASNARGLGLMLAFDLPSSGVRDKVVQEAFKNGLLLLGCGARSIRIAPPLIINEKEIDMGMEVLDNSIKRLK